MRYAGLLTLLITNLILTVACAPLKGFDKETDPEFYIYVDEFVKDGGLTGYSVPINFGETKPQDLGVCKMKTYNGNTYRKITINKDRWKYLSLDRRKFLIYHELAHCALGRRHHDEMRRDGCPKSIMHHYSITQYCIDKHERSYMDELFN